MTSSSTPGEFKAIYNHQFANSRVDLTRIHVGENTYKCNLCTAAFRLQAQLREHYRIHYDANQLRNMDAQDQKPLVSEMEMMVDQQQRQELQFAQHFEMIKNEKTELETKSLNLYDDLSGKKQKLDP
jgi:hypothetical protein